MYPYVPYVTCMLLVCYSYVTRMYSCGVVVMIIKIEHSVCDILKKKKKKTRVVFVRSIEIDQRERQVGHSNIHDNETASWVYVLFV